MSRPSPARLRLLLVALGTLFGLVLAEAVVRLLPVRIRGYTYADGVFSRPAEFEPDTTRNELGLHDEPLPPVQEGVSRVLLLGDSYVAAWTVPLPQTVGQRLEHHLRAGGGQWEVVSGGGNGWGQAEELVVLDKLGPLVQPALVVTLFVGENDVRNNHPELQAIGRHQIDALTRYRPGWLRLPAADAPFLWLPASELNRMVSYRLAMGRLVDQVVAEGMEAVPIDYLVYARRAPPVWDEAWQRTEALLAETRDRARALGADYAVVSASLPQGVLPVGEGAAALVRDYPPLAERDLDLDLPDQRLAELCSRLGVPLLRLQPELRRIRAEEGLPLHWPLDGHWDEVGNDRAAALIAPFVREQLGG